MKNGFFVLLAAAALSSCMMTAATKKTPLSVNSLLPSTDGAVSTSGKAKNNNYKVSVSITCMPQPGRLTPPASTYVVWIRKAGDPKAPAQNMGALVANKDNTASLDTITPLEAFTLWVSTEPTAQASVPTGQSLLWANIAQ